MRLSRFLPAMPVLLAALLTACGGSSNAPTDATVVPESTLATGNQFTFTTQGGTTITATVGRDPSGASRQVIGFSPFLQKTDGNLYNAALNSLWNIHGKQRGLFQLEAAELKPAPDLGGHAICWKVSNPAADFCIFPMKDSTTQDIAVMAVWTE